MNIQRFIAATSREAMSKARHTFGDSAVILSSRATDEGFEVMAAAEESLARWPGNSRLPRDRMPATHRSRSQRTRSVGTRLGGERYRGDVHEHAVVPGVCA